MTLLATRYRSDLWGYDARQLARSEAHARRALLSDKTPACQLQIAAYARTRSRKQSPVWTCQCGQRNGMGRAWCLDCGEDRS